MDEDGVFKVMLQIPRVQMSMLMNYLGKNEWTGMIFAFGLPEESGDLLKSIIASMPAVCFPPRVTQAQLLDIPMRNTGPFFFFLAVCPVPPLTPHSRTCPPSCLILAPALPSQACGI